MAEGRPAWTRQRKLLRFFEYPLALCLILILVTFILGEVHDLHGQAERMAVQGMIRSLQGAVLMQTSRKVHPSGEDIAPGDNPMQLMEELPKSYLGARSDVNPDKIKGGRWYFDTDKQMLIYRVKNAAGFASELSGPPRIRLRLEAARKMQVGQERSLACGPRLCLVLQEPYTW